MGKIILSSNIIFDQLKSNLVSDLQEVVIKNIILIFQHLELNNLNIDTELGIGMHGNYEGQQTYLIKINISIFNFELDFFIDYDQLEYYISLDNKIVNKCILENYINNKLIAEDFITYLKNDLNKLKIY